MDTLLIQAKKQLSQSGARPKHSLGQNFLIDQEVLEKIIAAASLQPAEIVLEIGPGLGVLTEALLNLGVNLTCFELDSALAKQIQEKFTQIAVIEGDAIQELPKFARQSLQDTDYAVVANIPYQITTALIERLYIDPRGFQRPTRAILLMQEEVAERLAALPGTSARGAISVLLQQVATVEKICRVLPTSFFPSPKVISAVVKVQPIDPLVDLAKWDAFSRFVRGAFTQRRKQLKNVLSGMLGIAVADIESMFMTINIDPFARAQELTSEQWRQLFTLSRRSR